MATLHALLVRCVPDQPTRRAIAAVPYDVVSTDEARALAGGNPLSFLHVSRAEIELPPGDRPVFRRRVSNAPRRNFDAPDRRSLVVEDEPERLLLPAAHGRPHADRRWPPAFRSTNTIATSSRSTSGRARDKEDDRTRHMMALGAQTGSGVPDLSRVRRTSTRSATRIDGRARRCSISTRRDGVRHTIVAGRRQRIGIALVAAFATRSRRSTSPTAIIAPRARRARATKCASAALPGTSLGDGADATTLLAVAFPHDQVQILSITAPSKDLGGRSA